MVLKSLKLNGTEIPIRQFKLKWLVPNPSICMVAKRGSGKSWVVRSILSHFRDIPGGVIIAPTDKMNTFYGNFFPSLYIHYEYKSEILEKILTRQKVIIKKTKQKMLEGKKVDPRAFLVMDDCLSTKGSWAKDKLISQLFYDGRHYKLMYILTMQYPLGLKPEFRTNFDYIFLLADDYITNRKRLWMNYAGMFPTFDSFCQVFDSLTEDFGSMVIVNRGNRAEFLDKIFWFKAGDEDIKKFGCRQFNDYHNMNYNSNWEEENEPFNINKYIDKKGKRGRLVVAKLDNN